MLSVNLPKTVAIRNTRLALVHFGVVLALAVLLIWSTFIDGKGYALEMPINTWLELSWDMDRSIAAMETYAATSCDEMLPSGVVSQRWGQTWDVNGACTKLCTLDEFFAHDAWNSRACWNDFKQFGFNLSYTPLQFLESAGRREVTLITAKNDWVVNHVYRRKTNQVEVVPQGRGGVLQFEYVYELSQSVPWFFWLPQSQVSRYGSNRNAKTVILDADRTPVGDVIAPGAPIQLTVEQVWLLAERFAGEAVRPLDGEALTKGAEITGRVECFTTDILSEAALGEDVRSQSWGFEASLDEPVCFLSFTMTSTEYQVNVNYLPSTTDHPMEVMSETTGITFKTIASSGTAFVMDLNTILGSLTSMIVLLALPTRLTSLIATRALGPISRMYRRVIKEPYDIEEQTAAMATIIAANLQSFHHLAAHDDAGNQDTIKLSTVKKVLKEAFKDRRDVLDSKELSSLAHFCYDAMHLRAQESHGEGLLEQLDIGLTGFACCGGKQDDEDRRIDKYEDGINLAQYNQVRLDGERMTFDAIVELFDKDRRRSWIEIFFTPENIKTSLMRAMDETEQEEFGRHIFSSIVRLGTFDVSTSLNGTRAASSWPSGTPSESSDEETGQKKPPTMTCDVGESAQKEGESSNEEPSAACSDEQELEEGSRSPPALYEMLLVPPPVAPGDLQEASGIEARSEHEPSKPFSMRSPGSPLMQAESTRTERSGDERPDDQRQKDPMIDEMSKRLSHLETRLAENLDTRSNWNEHRSAPPSAKTRPRMDIAWATAIMESLGDLVSTTPRISPKRGGEQVSQGARTAGVAGNYLASPSSKAFGALGA